MDNFSKFLNNKEELKHIVRLKHQVYKSYFTLFLLVLAFFMIFPMWRAGRAGILLWLALVVFLIFTLARQLMSKNNVYLLTSRRILFLRAINKENYRTHGAIQIKSIEEVSAHGFNNICLIVDEKKFYITGVKNRDKILNKIKVISEL
jgi:hypothetical protein